MHEPEEQDPVETSESAELAKLSLTCEADLFARETDC
jgi:hypothetical protein